MRDAGVRVPLPSGRPPARAGWLDDPRAASCRLRGARVDVIDRSSQLSPCALRCRRTSDDTEAISCEASDVVARGSSWTFRTHLGDGGWLNGCRDSQPRSWRLFRVTETVEPLISTPESWSAPSSWRIEAQQ